ncbi:MAG TPA: hypothetical protein VFZ68_05140 [Acidimicrobiales bacterium]
MLALAVPIVAGTTIYAWWWPPVRRQKLVRDLAASRSLVLDADAAALAERLLIAGHRGRHAGATIGGLSGVSVYSLWIDMRDAAGSPGMPLALFTAIFVAAALAGAVGTALAIRRAARATPGEPRLAHLRPPSLDDYLPPVMRWWSAVMFALATVALGVYVAVGAQSPFAGRRELAVGWVISGMGVLLTEGAGRLLTRSPQPAASPAALAVRDEIKGEQMTVVVAGAYGPSLICAAVAGGAVPAASGVGFILFVLPWVTERQRRRRVRERLWEAGPATP